MLTTSRAKYRDTLPQLGNSLFLADGGIETSLIFLDGIDLPYFASFDLFKSESGRASLETYFRHYGKIAARDGVGLILETATWRASPDWAAKLDYAPTELAEVNRQAVRMLEDVRAEFETEHTPVIISGCVGPRGDGYNPAFQMSAAEAEAYHAPQIRDFADSAADLVTAITMAYVEETIGIARAAKAAGMPVVISFTTETDGRLPTGQTLESAIKQVDAETDSAPLYYMVTCAHPEHFENVLEGDWVKRIRGVRANASRMSHAELDEAEELDAGKPEELAQQYRGLKARLPNLTVMGGCCGTDHRHIDAISQACTPLFR